MSASCAHVVEGGLDRVSGVSCHGRRVAGLGRRRSSDRIPKALAPDLGTKDPHLNSNRPHPNAVKPPHPSVPSTRSSSSLDRVYQLAPHGLAHCYTRSSALLHPVEHTATPGLATYYTRSSNLLDPVAQLARPHLPTLTTPSCDSCAGGALALSLTHVVSFYGCHSIEVEWFTEVCMGVLSSVCWCLRVAAIPQPVPLPMEEGMAEGAAGGRWLGAVVDGGVPFNAEAQRTRRNAEGGPVKSSHLGRRLTRSLSAPLCVLCISALDGTAVTTAP